MRILLMILLCLASGCASIPQERPADSKTSEFMQLGLFVFAGDSACRRNDAEDAFSNSAYIAMMAKQLNASLFQDALASLENRQDVRYLYFSYLYVLVQNPGTSQTLSILKNGIADADPQRDPYVYTLSCMEVARCSWLLADQGTAEQYARMAMASYLRRCIDIPGFNQNRIVGSGMAQFHAEMGAQSFLPRIYQEESIKLGHPDGVGKIGELFKHPPSDHFQDMLLSDWSLLPRSEFYHVDLFHKQTRRAYIDILNNGFGVNPN